MGLFSYRAMDADGRIVHGQIDALNPVDLELRLRRLRLDLVHGTPRSTGSTWTSGRIPQRDLIQFFFHLEQLVRAGIPILEVLADLRDSISQPRLREIVASLIESIEGGLTLSQAMAEHPRLFDRVLVSLVRAGETSGNLPEVLADITETMKWEDELRGQTRRLMIYPAIISVVLVVVIAILMIVVVPDLTRFFRGIGQPTPLGLELVAGLTTAMRAHWPIFVAVPIVLIVGTRFALRNNPGLRLRADAGKLALPIVGEVLRKLMLSRFARVFAMMYGSGIPVIDCIRASEGVVGNEAMRASLARAGNLIAEGQNVATAFQSAGLFPPLVIRMLRVGEGTGALDTALASVSYFYHRDVRDAIARAQAMIEPAMTIVLGALMLWVMMSVLGPIYDTISKINF